MMDNSQLLTQTIVVAIVAGILAQVVAEKIQMPSIIVLMVLGILLGPEILHVIDPSTLGPWLEVLVSLAVALILFEGGLSLDIKSFKAVSKSIQSMTTIGTLISALVGGSIVKFFIPELNWSICILIGVITDITGLTVINPILQRVRVKKEIATILKSESILGDAVGAFASIAVLEFILSSHGSIAQILSEFLSKLFVGSVCGYFMGFVLGKVLVRRYLSDEIKDIVVLAWVFGAFTLANSIESNSGILAVIFTAIAVQRENIPQLKTLKRFGGQLSILCISLLFILLSANLKLDYVLQFGRVGVFIVLCLMFIVRPLNVFISNHKLLSFKEKIFVSWIGPKGIVSASVASLFSIILSKHGIEGAHAVESITYLAIMITVLVQGLTAKPVAKLCGVIVEAGGIAIVGANALGRTLGKAFSELGKDVILVDNNIDHCKDAAVDDLDTVFGNCLDPAVLDAARLNNVETLIATTANSEVNFLVCQMAKENYHVKNVYPAIDNPEKGIHQKLVSDIGGNLAYAKTVSIKKWKQAVAKNKVKIIEWEMVDEKGGFLCNLEANGIAQDDWLPLILKRDREYFFAHADQEWQRGDVLICLSKET